MSQVSQCRDHYHFLFQSIVLILSASHYFIDLISFSFLYIIVYPFFINEIIRTVKNLDIYKSMDWAGVCLSWLIFTNNLFLSQFIPLYKKNLRKKGRATRSEK